MLYLLQPSLPIMAAKSHMFGAKIPHLLLLLNLFHYFSAVYSIGINYGTVGNNLPPPAAVAAFVKERTIFDKVKLFDTNPETLRAFANSGISVVVTVVNLDIPRLAQLSEAKNWVAANILPFLPQTKINYICVGNEILISGMDQLIQNLLPAMRSIREALLAAGINDIKITTPHSLNILASSNPPSSGRFSSVYEQSVLAPMLQFHRETNSPFTINPYPFLAYDENIKNFLLFQQNQGAQDPATGVTYTNMFDAMVDSVYSAMKSLGYGDVNLVVGETGWPSAGDPGRGQILENAQLYISNLINHVNSGQGTPLMPGKPLETYIFGLFNENQKPTLSEQHFGLFEPDFTPVYNSGALRGGQGLIQGQSVGGSKKWCIPKSNASEEALTLNLEFVCAIGVNCTGIQPGGACFEPENLRSHAGYAMNAYYQTHGRTDYSCGFRGTGVTTTVDPSYGDCHYIS